MLSSSSSSSSSSSFFFLHGSYLMSSITPSPLQFFKWDHFQTCSLNLTLIGSSCKFLIFEFFHRSAVERLAESFHLILV
jgi:hypothetical protein